MPFRLRLTEDENQMPLEFNCTIGYIEYLRSQLQGCQQPIHPCLVFVIQSFNTIGPRLGVYLDGTSYNRISIGDLGDRPGGYDDTSLDPEVENTRVGLILEVTDEQLIELYSLYQARENTEGPPYTWTTILPNDVVQPFDRQASILTGKLKEALYERVPYKLECPHCDERHSREELVKSVKTRPELRYLQSINDLHPSRIVVTACCPVVAKEIKLDSL